MTTFKKLIDDCKRHALESECEIVTEHKKNNKRHRVNGPAVIWSDGTGYWWLNGDWHRYYGPRTKNATAEWWINGRHVK